MPSPRLIDPALALPPALTTSSEPTPRNLSSTAESGSQLGSVAGLVAYFEAELQRFLMVFMGAKGPSNNKFHSILNFCFLDLYSGKSHLDCYSFCQ